MRASVAGSDNASLKSLEFEMVKMTFQAAQDERLADNRGEPRVEEAVSPPLVRYDDVLAESYLAGETVEGGLPGADPANADERDAASSLQESIALGVERSTSSGPAPITLAQVDDNHYRLMMARVEEKIRSGHIGKTALGVVEGIVGFAPMAVGGFGEVMEKVCLGFLEELNKSTAATVAVAVVEPGLIIASAVLGFLGMGIKNVANGVSWGLMKLFGDDTK